MGLSSTCLVSTAPGCGCFCEVQHVLNAIHSKVVTGRAELCALIVVIPMTCKSAKLNQQMGLLARVNPETLHAVGLVPAEAAFDQRPRHQK